MRMFKKWTPATDYEREPEVLPIYAPPCPECKHWKPVRMYDGARYDGVRLCHAEDMLRDFSCFELKAEPARPEPSSDFGPSPVPAMPMQPIRPGHEVQVDDEEIPF